MNLHLLIHNIGFIISAIAATGIAFFIFLNNRRSVPNITMALAALATIVFIISHVIGVNTSDPIISRNILMLNLCIFFIGMFLVHSILAYINKARERWFIIALVYVTGIVLTLWFIFNPDLFLLPSVPKMYFPNYYEAGLLNWTRIAFLYVLCLPYIFIEIALAFTASTDVRIRKQYMYLFIALITATGTGFIPNFLVYDIYIDPLWATAFMVIFGGIFVYGSLKYELFDIKIIARQAFVYSVGIALVGGMILLFDYLNRIILSVYTRFPEWIFPLTSGIIVVGIASLIWRRLRENEIIKYEFVTTVTHKFRTPLTHIKWASENLSQSITSPQDRIQLNYIQDANEKLVELTSLLMNISETENNDYEYKISTHSLSTFVSEIADGLSEQYEIKKLKITMDIEPGITTEFDESRIKFIVQTFIENAIHYTPVDGMITIRLRISGTNAVFSVTDSGIGIPSEELGRLFTKFYRGHNARLTDTEGMGIGLYMSKEIITRHRGKIWASSEGVGKGSSFNFSLPLRK